MPPPALLLLLLLLAAARAQRSSTVSGDYDCAKHIPAFALPSPSPDANCLSLLRHPDPSVVSRFDKCRKEVCYLFLQEAPFIILPDPMLAPPTASLLDEFQKPFPCGQPSLLHRSLAGIAFDLHAKTSSASSLCLWAGPASACTFNALVDFIHVMSDHGYQFAITGLLLELPRRQCFHEPSAPFLDNAMVIIGRNLEDSAAQKGPFFQLIRPFRPATWGIFAAVVFLFVLVCFAIAVRFHVFRGRSLVTAFFIFAGERDQAMAYEHASKKHDHPLAPTLPPHHNAQHRLPHAWRRRSSAAAADPNVRSTSPPQPQSSPSSLLHPNHGDMHQRNMAFATKYGLSMTLFRISLLAFIAIFALFYEVAVVNFLFQQQSLELDKRVKSLSNSELRNYSVLKNSALESVWDATVNRKGLKYDISDSSQIPWHRCPSAAECIRWTADEDHGANFVVTFAVVGEYLIQEESDCNQLTIFQTKDVLYQFNGGWLYSKNVPADFRKKVDREIVALRINGAIRTIIDNNIGEITCTQNPKPDIGPLIILVPVSLFVLPPLLGAIVVMLCWRTATHDEKQEPQDNTPDAKKMPGTSESRSSLLDSTSGEINLDGLLGRSSDSRIGSVVVDGQTQGQKTDGA